jgi:hypothetical protein
MAQGRRHMAQQRTPCNRPHGRPGCAATSCASAITLRRARWTGTQPVGRADPLGEDRAVARRAGGLRRPDLEPHGALVDDLAETMGADELTRFRIDGRMPLSELTRLLRDGVRLGAGGRFHRRAGAGAVLVCLRGQAQSRASANAGRTGRGSGTTARHRPRRRRAAGGAAHQDPDLSVADFLMSRPEHRRIVRRVQGLSQAPYREIRDNLLAAEMRPVDMLRCKLAFFGATNFDPRSDRWLRITMYRGAPYPDELHDVAEDAWLHHGRSFRAEGRRMTEVRAPCRRSGPRRPRRCGGGMRLGHGGRGGAGRAGPRKPRPSRRAGAGAACWAVNRTAHGARHMVRRNAVSAPWLRCPTVCPSRRRDPEGPVAAPLMLAAPLILIAREQGTSYTLRWDGRGAALHARGRGAQGDVTPTRLRVTLDPAPGGPAAPVPPDWRSRSRGRGRLGRAGDGSRRRRWCPKPPPPGRRGGARRCIGRLKGGPIMQVSVAEILERSRAALLAHGAGDWQAEAVARAVARAEETGNVICGLYYLESYCVQLVSGRVDGTRRARVVSRPRRAACASTRASASPNPPLPARCRWRWRRRAKTGWRRWRWRMPTPARRWGSSPNRSQRRA